MGGPDNMDGLGNHVYLEKQDKLRDIGVDIHTSQGLCTRYATQITLRRNPVKSIVISITPRTIADTVSKEKARAFRSELEGFDGNQLAAVIEKANAAMGIRSSPSKDDMSLRMFSDDILKIEISSPEHPHLTVIDVPGLFSVADEGLTTELDKLIVENMVQRYMENERIIVLAILSCLSDRATECEKAVVQPLRELVCGNTLKLGYFIVCNRGADEDALDILQCKMKEAELFTKPEWAPIVELGRTGVLALRAALQDLLTELAKQELPKQKVEVSKRLFNSRDTLKAMGPPRADPASQRQFLSSLASKFEGIVRDALEGRYESDLIFEDNPDMKLITKVCSLNEGFSSLMLRSGHTWTFGKTSKQPSSPPSSSTDQVGEQIAKYEAIAKESELRVSDFPGPQAHDLVPPLIVPVAQPKSTLAEFIDEIYSQSRGPELGSFGGALLPLAFRKQAANWSYLVQRHVQTVVADVFLFIIELLQHVFVEKKLRDTIWEIALSDKIVDSCRRAFEHADFLVKLELEGRPSTYDHHFNDNVQKARMERLTENLKTKIYFNASEPANSTIPWQVLQDAVNNKSNSDQIKEEIHDIMEAYYKVAHKRFVDIFCQQVVHYYLLDSLDSPLKVLTPALIMTMTDSTLDRIAGETQAARRERQRLQTEIEGLEAALQVLRS
ncbi:hypothetical protein B0T26DRAFT_744791 [Lasiosphaeria miniovina]|uniref:GED domain-containing protein n=1 Tax=Lasiosphaeria miniovina TaxID=1954250 RepID=A0AA40DG38_9PEZI|nr:uncharacterized protein B0T26DRAFT_744791 [Lasiosphaeria miniovina]KAK0701780.1 hypothetical protein B0T26DRAFT_744791 [Lasiosphaeria miniovina]